MSACSSGLQAAVAYLRFEELFDETLATARMHKLVWTIDDDLLPLWVIDEQANDAGLVAGEDAAFLPHILAAPGARVIAWLTHHERAPFRSGRVCLSLKCRSALVWRLELPAILCSSAAEPFFSFC